MAREILSLLVLLIAMAFLTTAAEADRLPARGAAWQKVLDRDPFQFSENDASVLFALSQFMGKCQIHMIYDPMKPGGITFKFVKGDKELFTIGGHTGSVFRTEKNILYFAHFTTGGQGCTVTAHDLDTGRKLWETELNAIPPQSHSGYSNRVTMGLSRLTGTEKEDEGIVSITARESFGDYIEVLDRETGRILAYKIYALK